jgi:hypothetical protein
VGAEPTEAVSTYSQVKARRAERRYVLRGCPDVVAFELEVAAAWEGVARLVALFGERRAVQIIKAVYGGQEPPSGGAKARSRAG